MSWNLIKLFSPFPLRLHLGMGAMDRSDFLPHSDTLFGALAHAFLLLYGEEELLGFLDRLRVSSVFPGIRFGGRDFLFFPVPLAITPSSVNLLERKRAKKVRWLSWEVLRRLPDYFNVTTHSFEVNFLDQKRFTILDSQYVVTKEELSSYPQERPSIGIGKVIEPHVLLHRDNNSSQDLYFQEDTWIVGSSSSLPFLFFLVANPDLRLASVLNLFCEEGLGGERFQGKGHFHSFEREDFGMPQEGEYAVLLSLTKPRQEEVSLLLAYELLLRQGFIFRGKPLGIRKRSHYKLLEGSLVRLPFEGENLDVSPHRELPVVSYGRAVYFAFSKKGE